MLHRVLATVFLGVFLSFFLSQLETRSLDMFFLDWKQILSFSNPPEVPLKLFDISDFKPNKGQKGEKFSAQELVILIKNFLKHNPKALVLTVAKSEVEFDLSEEEFAKQLSGLTNLYLFSNISIFEGATFDFHKKYKLHPRPLFLIPTYDSQLDDVSRRILIYFDLDKDIYNQDFDVVKNLFSEVMPPEYFRHTFEYLNTLQVYMRIWPWSDFGEKRIGKGDERLFLNESIKDKVVLLGASGIYSFTSSPSIMRRTNLGASKMGESYWPANRLIATYLTNFYSGEYVKTPSMPVAWLWLSLLIVSVSLLLLFSPVKQAFWYSSCAIISYVVLSYLAFEFLSLNLDVAKGLLVGLGSQYIVIPLRFMRYIRREEQEKYRSRILVKAATTEATLRMVGQVSHDIRSPLMALQVASSLLKGQVSGDLRDLIENATQRIRNISEDLFQRYKTKGSDLVQGDTSLKAALSELISSYEKVHEKARFVNQVPSDVIVYWPLYAIQRSFSNLLNNSLEACYAKGIDPVIEISAEKQAGIIVIYLKDNGPGIPAEHVKSLFKEGSTFNKKGGTGLGLYQVKKDLELTGGVVSYVPSTQGACFKIVVPMALEAVRFGVSENAVIVTAEDSASLQKRFENAGIKVSSFSTLSKAKEFLSVNPEKNLTLIADLLFPGEEETGFDLLDSLPQKHLYKAVLCTSLVESADIQELANKKGALLVRRSFFDSIQIAKAKA
ncbi:hypothetical protein AZI85_00080 [Bdellovibrio bacteriovorus]|uniref:histidine kinase n=1 Tax=Bdellovibrio bacteriovorus TaxID=959 RepID=A0A150WVA9_BDEBC|nr:HAMP domain-containing sensor histidine kinase [Bdellovibrio bacteriovorus]KYG70393.1 hypothetical protein AZI85_00080 [Bdellovibrio bacteriovorus]